MIVVSDTSPLTALLRVDQAGILRELFTEVVIPRAVEIELRRTHPVLPTWIRIGTVRDIQQVAQFRIALDDGEAEAIQLAKESAPIAF